MTVPVAPDAVFWSVAMGVTWLLVSVPAWALIAYEHKAKMRRTFLALTFAVLLAHVTACAGVEGYLQPIGDVCQYCTSWYCWFAGCW